MSLKLTNPFSYPLAMTAGGFLLFLGVRIVALPSLIMIPLAAAVTIATAYWRQHQEPTPEKERISQVQAELEGVTRAAQQLQHQAQVLQVQAQGILRQEQLSPLSMDILAAVQYGCDLAISLPQKVEMLAVKLPDTRSLLEANALKQQLQDVRAEKIKATGHSLASLERLESSLLRNLSLTTASQDDRQAQIHNLAALIQESAGVLQQLQNHLQTANLADTTQVDRLQGLVEEMNQLQQEMSLFV